METILKSRVLSQAESGGCYAVDFRCDSLEMRTLKDCCFIIVCCNNGFSRLWHPSLPSIDNGSPSESIRRTILISSSFVLSTLRFNPYPLPMPIAIVTIHYGDGVWYGNRVNRETIFWGPCNESANEFDIHVRSTHRHRSTQPLAFSTGNGKASICFCELSLGNGKASICFCELSFGNCDVGDIKMISILPKLFAPAIRND